MRTLLGLLLVLGLAAHPVVAKQEISYPFVTNVPGITEPMLSADYWLQRLEEKGARMSPAQIAAFNRNSIAVDPHLLDLSALEDTLDSEQLAALVGKVSRPASTARYFASSGKRVMADDYQQWQEATNVAALPAKSAVRWGLVVRRANMRSYPTDARILKTPTDVHLDRFQETAVFPGERVAVLHESADGQWLFVLNYHYGAWLRKEAVATGPRAEIESWLQRQPRLVVTGARVETNYNPGDSRSSRLPLEMGVTLPLVDAAGLGFSVNGQNPYTSHIVELPLRAADGLLEFSPALIARSRDVRPGYLPYNAASILTQAFKFLGERYGWGHDYAGRDCTGFIGEVYKSFGIVMPRNTGQQADSVFAPTMRFTPGDVKAVREALKTLQVGDLIYVPGHVVMYIGQHAGEPYVIHDKTVLEYLTAQGELYTGTLSGVSVTPLTPLQADADNGFLESIYAIKHIGAVKQQ